MDRYDYESAAALLMEAAERLPGREKKIARCALCDAAAGKGILKRLREETGEREFPASEMRSMARKAAEAWCRVKRVPVRTRNRSIHAMNALLAEAERMDPDFASADISDEITVVKDPYVETVKLLHQKDPKVTKKDIADILGVSTRSVVEYLQAVDVRSGKSPAMFGGYPMQVEIDVSREGHKNVYCTPNTLHPVALQLNVSQAFYLIHGLYAERDVLRDNLAAIIWSQLTDYGRERIREIYAWNDPDFMDYLDELDETNDEDGNRDIALFREEWRMSEEELTDPAEKLIFFLKDRHLCDLTVRIGGEFVTLRRQRIAFGNGGKYRAYPAGGRERDGVDFSPEDVKSITVSGNRKSKP